jgi:hypothetical protein
MDNPGSGKTAFEPLIVPIFALSVVWPKKNDVLVLMRWAIVGVRADIGICLTISIRCNLYYL